MNIRERVAWMVDSFFRRDKKDREQKTPPSSLITLALEAALKKEPYDAERLLLVKAVCERMPAIAASLEAMGFSPVEKLSVGLSIARENLELFFKFQEHAQIDFCDEEKQALAFDIARGNPAILVRVMRGLQFSSDAIREIFERSVGAEKTLIAREFDIPTDTIGKTLAEHRGQEEAFEQDGAVELVAETRTIEQELLLATERAWPDRVPRERLRAKIEQELRGTIRKIGSLGTTASLPQFLIFEGRNIPGIYKAARRERENFDFKKDVRGASVFPEWLTYQIDKALQLDIVPPTIVRDGPDGFGSVQD